MHEELRDLKANARHIIALGHDKTVCFILLPLLPRQYDRSIEWTIVDEPHRISRGNPLVANFQLCKRIQVLTLLASHFFNLYLNSYDIESTSCAFNICSLATMAIIPSVDYYDELAASYEDAFSHDPGLQKFIQASLDLLPANSKVFDVGCELENRY
jgi:hypothetical protein